MKYYIASCVFTAQFPELSRRIQKYVESRGDLCILRCCTPSWKVQIYEEKMPEGPLREAWQALPHTRQFQPEDAVWSLCHNCTNIVEESYPGAKGYSLWELIDQDDRFVFPDHRGMQVTIQDCWRSRDRAGEQAAVRNLLRKMHIAYTEADKHHGETDFCGMTLYRPQVARNPKMAPKHYAQGIDGLFLPHTEEEQKQIMQEYCRQYRTDTVVCYCHYCLEGLKAGGVDGRHIAQLLFPA